MIQAPSQLPHPMAPSIPTASQRISTPAETRAREILPSATSTIAPTQPHTSSRENRGFFSMLYQFFQSLLYYLTCFGCFGLFSKEEQAPIATAESNEFVQRQRFITQLVEQLEILRNRGRDDRSTTQVDRLTTNINFHLIDLFEANLANIEVRIRALQQGASEEAFYQNFPTTDSILQFRETQRRNREQELPLLPQQIQHLKTHLDRIIGTSQDATPFTRFRERLRSQELIFSELNFSLVDRSIVALRQQHYFRTGFERPSTS